MELQPILAGDEAGIAELSALATRIVREYYDPIIGPAQNSYMLARFQSVPAIRAQLAEGYRYYIPREDGAALGFLAFYPRGEELYLSKLYLDAPYRGRGYGRQLFQFVLDAARQLGKTCVTLNVNRHNPTTGIYERLGLRRWREEKNDIGSGYYMDDYVYRYDLTPAAG